MEIIFDHNADKNNKIEKSIEKFLSKVQTLEKKLKIPIVIFQDGVNNSYYIKCSIFTSVVWNLFDFDARLTIDSPESFRANRELLLNNKTYLKMKEDAMDGREFNDIIVEFNSSYNPAKPLKIWGGQHRAHAILEAKNDKERYHGFRIFFDLEKKQRAELALISNTNISVSTDTFDRMLEETMFGDVLRKWCQKIGFLSSSEDFPDVGSKSDKITVKLARSFIVNYYSGKDQGMKIKIDEIDKNVYEPYLVQTGVIIDPNYKKIIEEYGNNILVDKDLLEAGKAYNKLHKTQQNAVKNNPNIQNRKSFRNKALVESVICGWSYVVGLLQCNKGRLKNLYNISNTSSKILDPLNAQEMSKFKHDSDPPTYRGLGTRSSLKDRQRVAQVFLARSLYGTQILDKKLLNKAVSQVVGLLTMKKGYVPNA